MFFSYALFDMDGNQVPQELVTKVGEAFESILKEVSHLFFSYSLFLTSFLVNCFVIGEPKFSETLSRLDHENLNVIFFVNALFEVFMFLMQTEKVRQEHSEDMSILRAFSIVFGRRPDLRFNEMNY